ncbi:Reverse transcriptase (RNA-dependent DNA polymerase) [Popillia japonica]|uniref:Reverse transcriptase (RNA-dependent DNA polymerase) n=1 Tax=Popillia japonica TaxID=7064 RepID=A0AAW1IYX2_POPJA
MASEIDENFPARWCLKRSFSLVRNEDEIINRICEHLINLDKLNTILAYDDEKEENNLDKLNTILAYDDEKEENEDNDAGEDDRINAVMMQQQASGFITKSTAPRQIPKFMMTFKDIEETLSTFSGRDNYTIDKWIDEFEDVSILMNWNEVERLLKDDALLLVRSAKIITSWDILKKKLKYEFGKSITQLGNVDENALQDYIIEGIDDEETNKAVLYGANSFEEFKQKQKAKANIRDVSIAEEKDINQIAAAIEAKDRNASLVTNSAISPKTATNNVSKTGQMGAPMFSGNPITIRGLGNVETRTLGKFMSHVTIDSHQFSTDVHVVSDEAIPTKLIVGKPILEQVTLTISSEGIQVTAPTIFKHQNIDREQKEENVDVLIKTFGVLVANIDDELDIEIYEQTIKQMINTYSPRKPKDMKIRTRIMLEDEVPIHQQPRRLSLHEMKEVDKQLEEWLQQGVIRPSASDFASPIVLTPFGLCNAPAVFQRYINEVFRDLMKKGIVMSYMDDLIVPSNDVKEIENGTVRPSRKKIEAVADFPEPTTLKKVQSFLGLTGYFRKYIKDYSLIAKPLTDLLKNPREFRIFVDSKTIDRPSKKS